MLNKLSDKQKIPYGSKKEWQFSVIENNYCMSNTELGVKLGCTPFHVSRIKKEWRDSGRMVVFVLNEFMRLHTSDTVPDVDKYNRIGKLLDKLIELGYVLPENKAAQLVKIQIVDDERRVTDALKQYSMFTPAVQNTGSEEHVDKKDVSEAEANGREEE